MRDCLVAVCTALLILVPSIIVGLVFEFRDVILNLFYEVMK